MKPTKATVGRMLAGLRKCRKTEVLREWGATNRPAAFMRFNSLSLPAMLGSFEFQSPWG
jgi:hypothetical protein